MSACCPPSSSSSSSSSKPNDLSGAEPHIIYAVLVPERIKGTELHGLEQGPSAVWEFEESLRGAWSCYPGLSDAVKCQHIFDHLGDLPRQELRCYSAQITSEPDTIFKVLHQAFGDRRSWRELIGDFTGIQQCPSETVMGYSHRVNRAWQSIQRAQQQRNCVVVTDHLLKDMFVSGLLDPLVQSLLREDLFLRPELSFSNIREKAMRLEVPVCPELPSQSMAVIDQCARVVQKIEAISANFPTMKRKRRRRRRQRRRKSRVGRGLEDPVVSQVIIQDLAPTPSVVEEKMMETVHVDEENMWGLYGERGENMRGLIDLGCEVNVLRKTGEVPRVIELFGGVLDIKKVKTRIRNLGIIFVEPSG